jgi:hypothetical protein
MLSVFMLSVFMLSVFMLGVFMPSVFMLNVVAPLKGLARRDKHSIFLASL